MTLQQLEYVLALDRYRHFAKAADACGVTQPTLSAMIRKLEMELDVRLFNRSSQLVEATTVGRKVVEQAKAVLREAGLISDIVAEERKSLGGTFRLGILPTIAPYLLPRFVPLLSDRYPEIDLCLYEMKTAEICGALHDGEIDAAIAVNVGEVQGIKQTELYYEQFLAYVSRGSRLFHCKNIKTSEVSREFLWLLDEGHCFRDQLVRLCRLKAVSSSKMSYQLGSIETFMRMVEAGIGVTFIPELALEQLSASQRELVRPFGLPIPVREVVLLSGENYARQSVLDAVAGTIASSVPDRMLKMNNTEQRI